MNNILKLLVVNLNIILLTATISGISYSPYTANGCMSENEINTQLMALSQYTSRIRLFGADCNQVSTVLNTIESNQLNIKVTLGIWTRNGQSRFSSDTEAVLSALANPSYLKLVENVVVGNEELFNGGNEANIIANLNNVRSQISSANIQIPVSYVEVFNLWTPTLAEHSDIIMPTIYPCFTANNGSPLTEVAREAVGQMQTLMSTLKCSKPLVVGETGFPNSGSAPVLFATASDSNQCNYLSGFASEAQSKGVSYFFMEATDAAWKHGYPAEQHFGILNDSHQLRCPSLVSGY